MDIELHNHNRDFQASASMRRTADLVNFRAIGIRNERISYFSSHLDSLIQLCTVYTYHRFNARVNSLSAGPVFDSCSARDKKVKECGR